MYICWLIMRIFFAFRHSVAEFTFSVCTAKQWVFCFVFKIRFLLRLNKQSMALRRHFFLYPLNASKITMQDGELEWRQKRVFLLFNVHFFPMMELPFQSCSTSWHDLCMTCFSMHFTDVIVSSLQTVSSAGWPLEPFRIFERSSFSPSRTVVVERKPASVYCLFFFATAF